VDFMRDGEMAAALLVPCNWRFQFPVMRLNGKGNQWICSAIYL